MEEESWVYVDEGISSDESFSDSDKVDSETEAELYSLIHFEGNLSSLNCQSSVTKSVAESDGTFLLSDKTKYVLSTEKIEHERETELICNSDNFLQNGIDEFTGRENSDKTAVSDGSFIEVLNENEKIFPPDHQVPTNFGNNSNSDQLVDAQFPQKRKCDDSLENYSSLPKKAATDSRREIHLSNVDSLGNEDIQTNLCGGEDEDDVIFISSDSETDHSTPSKKRISQHQNMSMPNIKIGENSKDLWFVNQEDIIRARNIRSRRYHDKIDVTCSNCNRQGHHNRICPLPKRMRCFICGGDHTSTSCMNRICGKCYRTGHDRMACRLSKINTCALCRMQGHTKQNCPDLWRRYHLTTQPGQIVPDKKFKPNSFVFCCTCGKPGHFGAVCNFERRGYKNCFPTWPNVLSYDEPLSLPEQTSKTTRSEKRKKALEKKVRKEGQEKKVPTEAEILARKERLKKARKLRIQKRKERRQLERQQLLNSKKEGDPKVLKEKDFPRTPKNNSKTNLFSPSSKTNLFNPSSKTNQLIPKTGKDFPRTPKNNSASNLSSPRNLNYNSKPHLFSPGSKTNQLIPKTEKNASPVNQSSFRSPVKNSATNLSSMRMLEDDSVIILPTPKKTISVVDLTSPKNKKNNPTFDDSIDLPESVRMMMRVRERRREKKRRRRLNKRQNLKEREQSQNKST